MSTPINILIDELPNSLIIDDIEYSISSDFRTFVLFELLLTDKTLSAEQKLCEMINLIFPDENERPPLITEEVIDSIVDFYRCGKKETKAQEVTRKKAKNQKKIYDFEWDDAYIYSAFVSCYQIDLNEIDYLHWWKFKALFNGLPSDCEFVKIMGYRGTDISQIKDKQEKARIIKLQSVYALPENLTLEEKAAKFGAILGGSIK